MSIACVTFSASERDSETAEDWRERPGSKVLEIWPVPRVRWKVSLNQTDSKPFLRAKQKPKINRRWVKLASKRSVSGYRGFPSRWLLWVVTGSSPPRRKKTKNAWSQVRKKNFSSNVSFVLHFSVPLLINFPSVSYAFFRHEQHVSLMLPLSVSSEIIISWNVQFFTKKMISRRNN